MAARIGADDLVFFETPRPDLLREVSGIEPEAPGTHVLLDGDAHVRSTQRLALADFGGGVVVGLWPAELKSQAEYLYRDGRASAMIAAARERRWTVEGSPQLAFYNSRPAQRLYLRPTVSAEEYVRRWEGGDGRRIGQHSRDEVQRSLWPWLKERGYASASDDGVLDDFLAILGRRPAHLRPGMRLRRHWDAGALRELGGRAEIARAIRRDVNLILGAAGEPVLPTRTH
jgi:hypothetical protein